MTATPTATAAAVADADLPALDGEWAIVELLGHRRVAGYVSQDQVAGAGMLRVEIPAVPGQPAHTSWYSPAAVYGIHPVAEDIARAAAAHNEHRPVHRWELPAAQPPAPRPVAGADDLNDGYLADDLATAELGEDLDDLADLDDGEDDSDDAVAADAAGDKDSPDTWTGACW
jgi:hypothetical protein